MARFAAGKDAYGISDRSGFRYRLREMRKEWNGSLVGPDEYEPKHPQLEPIRAIPDAEALRNPRPDTSDDNIPFVVFTSTGKDIIPSSIKDLSVLTGSVGTVAITSTVASSSSTTASTTVGTSAVGSVEVYQLFAVTVVDDGGNKYFLDGSNQTGSAITLNEGSTYRFDQSHSSNSGHPLRFSTTSNGTHGGGSEYTTGVTTAGTPGSAGAYTQITVAVGAPTLYYYCTNHSGMGGQANTP
jgi:hypothetical protein